jgi:hypothetical protein
LRHMELTIFGTLKQFGKPSVALIAMQTADF